jgi:hypothetical protein
LLSMVAGAAAAYGFSAMVAITAVFILLQRPFPTAMRVRL